MDSHRASEDQEKKFYVSLEKALSESNIHFSWKEDIVSHWMLKILFQDIDKGAFFMNENYLFSNGLNLQAHRWAKKILGESRQHMEDLVKKFHRHYMFDMLVKYKGDDPFDEKLFKNSPMRGYDSIKDADMGRVQTILETLDSRSVRIPFKYCHRLIQNYSVEIEAGMALVTPQDAYIVLQELFQEILTIHHNNLKVILPKMLESDDRIKSALGFMREYYKSPVHYEKTEFKYDKLQVTLQHVPNLAKHHFPLCMAEIYNGFRLKHSLKHWGRL